MIHSLTRVQDATTGLWYQILDQGGCEGNYTEASASCMFVYAIAKGIRKGYLGPECLEVAQKGYAGIIEHLVEVDKDGLVNLTGICRVAGLGGEQQRDGSVEYYLSEPVGANDYKGVGPFILAGVELGRLSEST
jgi:unsaturated rhamnogalacturonyl hydrolase